MGNQRTVRQLKWGIIATPAGEEFEDKILNFMLHVGGFPRAEKIVRSKKRIISRKALLKEIKKMRGTLVIDTDAFLKRSPELRWFGPGQDDFPRNAQLLMWLDAETRTAHFETHSHKRYLLFIHQLHPFPEGMSIDQITPIRIAYSIGRLMTSESEFIAIQRNGQIEFLKNRGAPVPSFSIR